MKKLIETRRGGDGGLHVTTRYELNYATHSSSVQ